MLDKNFIPPDAKVTMHETARRLALIDEFLPLIRPSITGLMVSGSMAYGRDFSVSEKSDVDMQLTVTRTSVSGLVDTGFFNAGNLGAVLDAYLSGIIQQFSLPFELKGVSMECHFWDERAYTDAITMVSASIPRLRSSLSPSKDYGYSFGGEENIAEFTGQEIGGHIVSDFPSYRIVDGKRFFCRPVTNVLGCMRIVHGHDWLEPVLDTVWKNVVRQLQESETAGVIDLSTRNILNCLPGKNKVSPESKARILARTIQELDAIGAEHSQ